MSDICILPARGGSKRIPRKNIRLFAGRPMISWPLTVAQEAKCFERIIVSTDDREIADVALSLGAEVPFLRPADLADDFTPTVAVVRHTLEAVRLEGTEVDRVCCLYPTAAFVTQQDLLTCRDMLADADFAIPIGEFSTPIERAFRLSTAGELSMDRPERYNTRSQDLPPAYFDSGQFYWGHAEAWLSDRDFFDHRVAGHVLSRHKAQDIDTLEDWDFAERLFSLL